MIVAVAVNGNIVAVTRTFINDDGVTEYGALIPPDALHDGDNGIQLIGVRGNGANRVFFHLAG
jgi:hypothetical protein